MAQFNPYAPQSPYGGVPQGSFPPPQQSPYGGGFPPQMQQQADAFGPGMGAPMGPGGGLRPYETGGFADDSNGDLSGGSEGGLLSKIFSLKGLLTIGGIGAAAYAVKRFLIDKTDETSGHQEESPALQANQELQEAFDSLEESDDPTTVHGIIEAHLKALNDIELPDAPSDGPDPYKAQRKALTELNAAYNYDPEAEEDTYKAAVALKTPNASKIKAAHTEFAKAFKHFTPPSNQ